MPDEPAKPTVGDKLIEADRVPPATQAWWTSPQVIAAVAAIAGGIVGVSHFCCIYLGVCLLEKISMEGWTLFLGGVLAIFGGGYALYRRIKVGLDANNTAAKITFF